LEFNRPDDPIRGPAGGNEGVAPGKPKVNADCEAGVVVNTPVVGLNEYGLQLSCWCRRCKVVFCQKAGVAKDSPPTAKICFAPVSFALNWPN